MRRILPLLALPVLLGVAVLWFSQARGAFWLGRNLDPAYIYLFNGLNVARLLPPAYHDSPGTPVVIAAGVLVRATHFVAGHDSIVLDVFRRPESYLAVIHAAFAGVYLLVAAMAGWAVLRVTGSVALAVASQAAPLLSENGMEALTRVSPEPVLMSLSLAFAVLLLAYAEKGTPADERRFSILAGVGAGLLVATKFTALPLALVPLAFFVAPFRRHALLRYGAAATLTFVVCTLPIRSRYLEILAWLVKIATHGGNYGDGPPGFADPWLYWTNLRNSIRAEIPAVALVLGACCVLWLVRRDRDAASPDARPLRVRLLAGFAVMTVVQFLLCAKQPMPRYLVPALGTLGVVIALLVLCLGAQRLARPGVRPALAVAALGLILVQASALLDLRSRRADELRQQQRIVAEARSPRYARMPRIYSYAASAPVYALHFGNEYTERRYDTVMQNLHPGIVLHDPFSGRMRTFAGKVRPAQLAKKGPFLYQGPPHEGYQGFRLDPPAGATYRVLLKTPVEALYEASFVDPAASSRAAPGSAPPSAAASTR